MATELCRVGVGNEELPSIKSQSSSIVLQGHAEN